MVEYVPWASIFPKPKTPSDIPPPESWDEWTLHQHSIRVRAAEIEPSTYIDYPIGTRTRDLSGDVWVLEEFDFEDPRLVFIEGIPSNPTVDKYVDWIRKGSMPPPIRALETYKHNINVIEGHHRAAALKKAGIKKVRVWVNKLLEVHDVNWKMDVDLKPDERIVQMSPHEYINRINLKNRMTDKELKNYITTSIKSGCKGVLFYPPYSEKNMEDLKQKMLEGVVFDLPAIHYKNGLVYDQEGYHRTIAAMNLGQDKIPVLIIGDMPGSYKLADITFDIEGHMQR